MTPRHHNPWVGTHHPLAFRDGDPERDERSREEPAAARAERACVRYDDGPGRSEWSLKSAALGGRDRRFGGKYGLGTGMRSQRWRRERRPSRWSRRAMLTAGASCRANDTSIPSTKNEASSDVPPAEMNGSGMPVTGN